MPVPDNKSRAWITNFYENFLSGRLIDSDLGDYYEDLRFDKIILQRILFFEDNFLSKKLVDSDTSDISYSYKSHGVVLNRIFFIQEDFTFTKFDVDLSSVFGDPVRQDNSAVLERIHPPSDDFYGLTHTDVDLTFPASYNPISWIWGSHKFILTRAPKTNRSHARIKNTVAKHNKSKLAIASNKASRSRMFIAVGNKSKALVKTPRLHDGKSRAEIVGAYVRLNHNRSRFNISETKNKDNKSKALIIVSSVPDSPDLLVCMGSTNPLNIGTTTPSFAAFYRDSNPYGIANKYRMQVSSEPFTGPNDEDTTGVLMWDSSPAGIAMANVNVDNRCNDITYVGSGLSLANLYFWRIRFFNNNNFGPWSTESGFFSIRDNTPPDTPDTLRINDIENLQNIEDASATFSAYYRDPDIIDTATYFNIKFSTISGVELLQTGVLPVFPPVPTDGKVSTSITFSGLTKNVPLYWQIMMFDSFGESSPWSTNGLFSLKNPEDPPVPEPGGGDPWTDPGGGGGWSGGGTGGSTGGGTGGSWWGGDGSPIDDPDVPPPVVEEFTVDTIPYSLYCEGEVNPTTVVDFEPEFTAIFRTVSPSHLAVKAYVQVIKNTTSGDNDPSHCGFVNQTDSGFTGMLVGQFTKSVSPVTNNNRCQDIEYNSNPLNPLTLYKWRIRFERDDGVLTGWSEETVTFVTQNIGSRPGSPYTLLTNDRKNPIDLGTDRLYFSGIYLDGVSGYYATKYKIQIVESGVFTGAGDSQFTGTQAYISDLTTFPSGLTVQQLNRSPNLYYPTLAPSLKKSTLYHWRLKFYNDQGMLGRWSIENAFYCSKEWNLWPLKLQSFPEMSNVWPT